VIRRPGPTEAPDFFFRYIDLVQLDPGQEICSYLRIQLDEAREIARRVDDVLAGYRYAPGKWTLRQVVGHVSDTERVFAYRAFWFARGFEGPLPSFDEDAAVGRAESDGRTWPSLVDEFGAVRLATLALFEHLPEDAWDRRGIANANPYTVRAIAFGAAGHVTHHLRLIRERYLVGRH
jgi:hypothetical protein